jgi:putative selenium metabolism hydrolase
MTNLQEIKAAVHRIDAQAVEFFRNLIRTPSFSGREQPAVELCQREMHKLGYDEVKIDGFGNVIGRIGHGKHHVAFDAHIDTVEVGDPSLWKVDPFAAVMKDGVIYGRGASDQKGGMASLVYAGHLVKKLGLAPDITYWAVGSVFEEDCDGLCWQYILNNKEITPELVVITEPTNLQVYRGHRGRMEIEVATAGLSCHGSAPERGINAVYRMAPIIAGIEKLNQQLKGDKFLGKGTVTISQVRSTSPSLCAVADSCTINLDRRLAATENEQLAIAQIKKVAGRERIGIKVLDFNSPTWKGLVYPTKKYYPTWLVKEEHPLCRLALDTYKEAFGRKAKAGKWTFSTNGIATMGMFGIPTIGFGPANEKFAHAPTDQCPADHIGKAILFYAHLVKKAQADFPRA